MNVEEFRRATEAIEKLKEMVGRGATLSVKIEIEGDTLTFDNAGTARTLPDENRDSR